MVDGVCGAKNRVFEDVIGRSMVSFVWSMGFFAKKILVDCKIFV